MSNATYKCELCGRDNFKSQRGLSKHKLENKGCRDHLKARFGSNTDAKIAAAYLSVDTVHILLAISNGTHLASRGLPNSLLGHLVPRRILAQPLHK